MQFAYKFFYFISVSKTSPTLSGSYPLGNHVTSNKPRLGISELGSGNSSSTSSPVPSIKQPLLSTLGKYTHALVD